MRHPVARLRPAALAALYLLDMIATATLIPELKGKELQ